MYSSTAKRYASKVELRWVARDCNVFGIDFLNDIHTLNFKPIPINIFPRGVYEQEIEVHFL